MTNSIRSLAQDGYTLWRGAIRHHRLPDHWDDLSEAERECFTAVAAYALGAVFQEAYRDERDDPDNINYAASRDEGPKGTTP